MKRGLDWYKREPVAYLGGVQGMGAREHAVYAVVLELIYVHGGSINNDPGWIAGWISDMGAASVRNTIAALVERGKLQIEVGQITQKRAQNECKTRTKPSENATKTEGKPGKNETFSEGEPKSANDLGGDDVPSKKKRREDKEKKEPPKAPQGGRDDDAEFEEWWALFPRKVAKGQARRAYRRARGKVDAETLTKGVRRFSAKMQGKEAEYIAHASTWLNGERWADEEGVSQPAITAEQQQNQHELRVARAKKWLSRKPTIPDWMDHRETAEALLAEGYDYDRLKAAGFTLPAKGEIIDISECVRGLAAVRRVGGR